MNGMISLSVAMLAGTASQYARPGSQLALATKWFKKFTDKIENGSRDAGNKNYQEIMFLLSLFDEAVDEVRYSDDEIERLSRLSSASEIEAELGRTSVGSRKSIENALSNVSPRESSIFKSTKSVDTQELERTVYSLIPNTFARDFVSAINPLDFFVRMGKLTSKGTETTPQLVRAMAKLGVNSAGTLLTKYPRIINYATGASQSAKDLGFIKTKELFQCLGHVSVPKSPCVLDEYEQYAASVNFMRGVTSAILLASPFIIAQSPNSADAFDVLDAFNAFLYPVLRN